jgi:hypothetical protein
MDNDDTITINTGSSTINISDITADVIDIDSLTWDHSLDTTTTITLDNWTEPKEFEDMMPSVAKIEDMCNDYPSLAKAYENFKSIYSMVHQDWQGRQREEL